MTIRMLLDCNGVYLTAGNDIGKSMALLQRESCFFDKTLIAYDGRKERVYALICSENQVELPELMSVHILRKLCCLCPILDSPVFKIPFIHIWIAFIIDIKNDTIGNDKISREIINI